MKCPSVSTAATRGFLAAGLALCLLFNGAALAAEHMGAYAGGGLGFGTTRLTDQAFFYTDNPSKSLTVLEGHGGYRFNPWFAVEGQILGSANGDSNGDKKIAFAGLSARALGIAPLTDLVDLYALVGFYTGSSEAGFSDTVHESGAVYGAGLGLNFGDRGQYGVRGTFEVYKGNDLLDQVQVFTVFFQYNFFK